MRRPSASPALALRAVVLSLTMFAAACSDSSGTDGGSEATTASVPMATSDLVAGERALLSLGTHCGVRVLSRLINDRVWRTNEGAGEIDWIPPEWHVDESRPDGPIVVEALLAADGESITVSKGGRSVVYLAGGSGFEERDLCS